VFEVYHGQAFCLQAMQDGASRWQLRKQLLKKAVVWVSNVEFFLGPYCVTKCLTAPIYFCSNSSIHWPHRPMTLGPSCVSDAKPITDTQTQCRML
jgi:hypothetical protein